MADEKRVIGAEELELLHGGPIFGLQSGGGHNERNVVARIRVHDLVCTYRPINPLDLVIPRVLNHDRRRLRRLTVPHPLLSFSPEKPNRKSQKQKAPQMSQVNNCWKVSVFDKRGLVF